MKIRNVRCIISHKDQLNRKKNEGSTHIISANNNDHSLPKNFIESQVVYNILDYIYYNL